MRALQSVFAEFNDAFCASIFQQIWLQFLLSHLIQIRVQRFCLRCP